MAKEYIYAASVIHSREMSLLTRLDLESLLLCKNYKECINMLKDRGWGSDEFDTAEDILKAEEKKLWELIDELVLEKEVFNVLRYRSDFHNLKVAIKTVVTNSSPDELLQSNGLITGEEIVKAVRNRSFELLPYYLQSCCEKAFKALLETGNGQICDIIIDKSCVEFIYQAGQKDENEIIRLYTRYLVLSTDIKTAVRCGKLNKSLDFTKNAISDCGVLDKDALVQASFLGIDEICNYLLTTPYADGASELEISLTRFEKWCDNFLMDNLKSQKNEHFTIGPLVAYILARETEIKAVRLILSAKLNDIDSDIIKERLRDMYA